MSRKKLSQSLRLQVTYASARTCCVCRIPRKPAQIHHIDEDPSNNVASNLALLCHDCHDDAHTVRKLSQNLTSDDIREYKARWESEVATLVSRSMLSSGAGEWALWTYVNHDRLHFFLDTAGIGYQKNKLSGLVVRGAVDELGIIQPMVQPSATRETWTTYDYLPHHLSLAAHQMYASSIDDLISVVNPIDLDAIWSRAEMKALLKPGSYLYTTRGFYFKDYERNAELKYNMRLCYTKKRRIRVEFRVSTRSMFGDSSIYDSFCGHRFVGALLVLKSMSAEGGVLQLNCTPVAMGMGFMEARQSPLHGQAAPASQMDADS